MPTKTNGTPVAFGLAKLAKLAAQHEAKAAALRAAITVLTEDAHGKVQQRAHTTIGRAIDADQARRQHRRLPKNQQPGYGTKKARAARAKQTRAFLAHFDPETPKAAPPSGARGKGLGTLLRHGYLKKRGDGYVRTAKPFGAS